MDQQSVQWHLLMLLADQFEEDWGRFVVIPQPLLQASPVRSAVEELRNEQYVEERVGGVIRLTSHGYLMCQKELLGFIHCESE
jgi:hypothetical protein